MDAWRPGGSLRRWAAAHGWAGAGGEAVCRGGSKVQVRRCSEVQGDRCSEVLRSRGEEGEDVYCGGEAGDRRHLHHLPLILQHIHLLHTLLHLLLLTLNVLSPLPHLPLEHISCPSLPHLPHHGYGPGTLGQRTEVGTLLIYPQFFFWHCQLFVELFYAMC